MWFWPISAAMRIKGRLQALLMVIISAAYRQLLPHYSDGTAQQLSGLADMATGAVSQHLQLIIGGSGAAAMAGAAP